MKNSNKVIFLDIDGVLVTKEVFEEDPFTDEVSCWMHKFHKPSVDALNHLIEKTGAFVVISSSWRNMHTFEELKQKFEREGAHFNFHEDWRTIRNYDWKRGQEVSEWLSRHPEITSWASIDDDNDFLPENNLFQTSFSRGGLTEEIANSVIAHLNKL